MEGAAFFFREGLFRGPLFAADTDLFMDALHRAVANVTESESMFGLCGMTDLPSFFNAHIDVHLEGIIAPPRARRACRPWSCGRPQSEPNLPLAQACATHPNQQGGGWRPPELCPCQLVSSDQCAKYGPVAHTLRRGAAPSARGPAPIRPAPITTHTPRKLPTFHKGVFTPGSYRRLSCISGIPNTYESESSSSSRFAAATHAILGLTAG
jgi:hypothetical protein